MGGEVPDDRPVTLLKRNSQDLLTTHDPLRLQGLKVSIEALDGAEPLIPRPRFAAPVSFKELEKGHDDGDVHAVECQFADPDRDYPIVRVFATAGWIVAGWVVSFLFHAEESPVQFYVAGAAALIVGTYSFFLPKTSPPAKGKSVRIGELYGADTLPYFKHWPFAVFMFGSLMACIGMMPYWSLGSPFANTVGIERTGGFFTMGQIAELFVLALVLPHFIKRFGIKWTMVVGLLSWVLRFLLFSGAATASGSTMMTMMVIAVILHGFSYDFVFVAGYLYVDRHVHEEIRAQAQGLLVVFTQGIGFLVSSLIFVGLIFPRIVVDDTVGAEWQRFWLTPVGFMAAVLGLFWFLFRDDKTSARESSRT